MTAPPALIRKVLHRDKQQAFPCGALHHGARIGNDLLPRLVKPAQPKLETIQRFTTLDSAQRPLVQRQEPAIRRPQLENSRHLLQGTDAPLVARETVHGQCSRIPIDHLLGLGRDDYARSEVLNCRVPTRFASPQCLLRLRSVMSVQLPR